jgi:hypothetical protein
MVSFPSNGKISNGAKSDHEVQVKRQGVNIGMITKFDSRINS